MVKHRGDDICGVLLLNKPTGDSSNQILQRIKRLFNAKKAGHTGSLDPLATGLLPCCFGKATCLSEYFLHSDKRYEAVIQFGVSTDSHDVDGSVTATQPVAFSEQDFQQALQAFTGDIEQIPPMVSALKHQGQPLYKLALQGREIERKPRKMTVFSLTGELLGGGRAKIAVHCSSGFYVRQLAADLGERLQCGAHITALHRTASKYLSIDAALTPRQIEDHLEGLEGDERRVAITELLLSPDELLVFLPRVEVSDDAAQHLTHGRRIDVPETLLNHDPQQHVRVYQGVDKFLGIGERRPVDKLKMRRLFRA